MSSSRKALGKLAANFTREKASRAGKKPMPRPGTLVPLRFASQDRLSAHAELLEDFIQRVLGMEWAWISDLSTLADFGAVKQEELIVEKIREIYGGDVSGIQGGNIADILDRIAQHRAR